MKLKGIIDCDFTNYKEPVLTLEFPYCDFKCDKLNKCQVCQNNLLIQEPTIEIPLKKIWELYRQNPLTKGFCLQGLEPLDSVEDVLNFVKYIRGNNHCYDPIIIYTGYNKEEVTKFIYQITEYENIIIKWGRFILGEKPHYDEVLGVNLASNNQYAEKMFYANACYDK